MQAGRGCVGSTELRTWYRAGSDPPTSGGVAPAQTGPSLVLNNCSRLHPYQRSHHRFHRHHCRCDASAQAVGYVISDDTRILNKVYITRRRSPSNPTAQSPLSLYLIKGMYVYML